MNLMLIIWTQIHNLIFNANLRGIIYIQLDIAVQQQNVSLSAYWLASTYSSHHDYTNNASVPYQNTALFQIRVYLWCHNAIIKQPSGDLMHGWLLTTCFTNDQVMFLHVEQYRSSQSCSNLTLVTIPGCSLSTPQQQQSTHVWSYHTYKTNRAEKDG